MTGAEELPAETSPQDDLTLGVTFDVPSELQNSSLDPTVFDDVKLESVTANTLEEVSQHNE